MQKLDFDKVMEIVGIDTNESKKLGISINFEKYYAIINGKIPLEVVSRVLEKYSYKYCKITDENKSNLNGYQYLEKINIDSKEGLVIFLIEMKNYYFRIYNFPEIKDDIISNLIKTIDLEILKKIESINAFDWMQSDEENRKEYNLTIKKDASSVLWQKLRNTILRFDEAVFPVLDDASLKDNYFKNGTISGNVFNSFEGKIRYGCCHLDILTSNPSNFTSYWRLPDGFKFALFYELPENKYLNVIHYFSSNKNKLEKGEVLQIQYFGGDTKERLKFKFNITQKKLVENDRNKIILNSDQIEFICLKLEEAISYAFYITDNVMERKQKVKSII